MQYSAQHRMCVYDVPDPEEICSIVPGAWQPRAGSLAVPADYQSMLLMRRLGYPVVAPILLDYDWPAAPDTKPWPQQLHMASFMSMHTHCFNLSDMRTGKTLSTLWAADYLMGLGMMKRALILAPLSTIHRIWETEIYRNFLSRRKAVVLHDIAAKRLELLDRPADFYLLNHDGISVGKHKGRKGELLLGPLAERLIERSDIDAVIVDEGSAFRERTTNRSKILRKIRGSKQWCWWLTGTPTPNEPSDAWAQADIVRPDYNESFRMFHDRTMYRITQFKWLPRQNASECVAEILQPSIRFDRHQCHGTLPIKPEVVDVDLTPSQKKAMKDLKENMRLTMGDGNIVAFNEATLRGKLIQISSGAVYGEDREILLTDCKPRFQQLMELIEEAGHKVIVFAPLTGVVNLLYKEISKTYSTERVIGSVSPKKRNEIFRSFQEQDNPRVIVADPRTMSHGLTLTAADTIIWFTPCDMSETFIQANCRIEGSDQQDWPAVFCLASTATEREVYRRLEARESFQGITLKFVQEVFA